MTETARMLTGRQSSGWRVTQQKAFFFVIIDFFTPNLGAPYKDTLQQVNDSKLTDPEPKGLNISNFPALNCANLTFESPLQIAVWGQSQRPFQVE